MARSFRKVALQYANDVVDGKRIAGKEIILACQRFIDDLKRDDIELRTADPDLAINIMQSVLVHQQGEDMDGNPLQGKPFILEP